MFWKKKGKGVNKEQHPNTDKVNIRSLGEYDGFEVLEVTYLHKPNTQHPTEQKGDRNLWELLYGGKPMGWGKTRVQYLKLPSMSAEERAELEAKKLELEAEKLEKARLHEESAKLSGIPITREDIDVYLKSRWAKGDHLVYNLYHDGDKGAEDTVSVLVHCDPANRFEKIEFTEALEATNPGLFHDVFIDDENGYWGWDDTLISFTGASGTRFTVSCYKIRRGDFYVHMGAGLHGGKAPITAENFKELDAVVETFRYLNSLPTTPSESDNYSD